MKQLNWYQIFGKSNIPDGRTVLPTDDIQIWLQCANIWNKTYTTLAEVLADTDTLLALINSNNAVDYMVRSTTWAVAQALVPTMTSDTTPSGKCIAKSVDGTAYRWLAFDGDDSTAYWSDAGLSGEYIGYVFPSNVDIAKIKMRSSCNSTNTLTYTYKVQASDDEFSSDIVDVSETFSETYVNRSVNVSEVNVTPTVGKNAYRVYRTSSSARLGVLTLQFYSPAICDNATAMSYIGLNNYCANTLLADSTWCNAICNSEYFESVLNVKVPTMTSNTTPSGECSASDVYSERYAWKAFDGDDTTRWNCNTSSGSKWVQYSFASPKKIYCMDYMCNTYSAYTSGITVTGDGNTVSFLEKPTSENKIRNVFASVGTYTAYRCTYTASYVCGAFTIQFYGREDV